MPFHSTKNLCIAICQYQPCLMYNVNNLQIFKHLTLKESNKNRDKKYQYWKHTYDRDRKKEIEWDMMRYSEIKWDMK